MKNRIIYTEDKIYAYLKSGLNQSEFRKVKNKIQFIKSNYNVNQIIMIYNDI